MGGYVPDADGDEGEGRQDFFQQDGCRNSGKPSPFTSFYDAVGPTAFVVIFASPSLRLFCGEHNARGPNALALEPIDSRLETSIEIEGWRPSKQFRCSRDIRPATTWIVDR